LQWGDLILEQAAAIVLLYGGLGWTKDVRFLFFRSNFIIKACNFSGGIYEIPIMGDAWLLPATL
jgi:hypothetical protein